MVLSEGGWAAIDVAIYDSNNNLPHCLTGHISNHFNNAKFVEALGLLHAIRFAHILGLFASNVII